jgi:hypothetical protein
MNDPRAPSSDLEHARALSRRLRGPQGTAPQRPEPSPRYIHFDARRAAPDAWLSPMSRAAAPFGADVWNELLDGCLASADAAAAFLMDGHGLVVATRGALKQQDAEAIGGRLMAALDQIELIDRTGPTCTVAIEFEGAWLTGLRFTQSAGRTMTVAVFAGAPLPRDARDVIEGLVATATQE